MQSSPNQPNYSQPPLGPQPRRTSMVGPVILIILGLAFLAQNLNLFEWDIWNVLWRLWPVWLIALGLDIMIGRRTSWGSWAVVTVVIAVIGGALWYDANFGGTYTAGTREPVAIIQPVGNATRAEVLIDSSVSRLEVRGGGSDTLVEGTVTPLRNERISEDAHNSGDTLVFNLRSRNEQGGIFSLPFNGDFSAPTWDLRLSDKIPMSVKVDTGVGASYLDLSSIQLTDLEIDSGVGETEVSLPGTGRYRVDIDGGVGQFTVRIPRGLAVRITVDQGLGAVSVNGDFDRDGKAYISPNFSEAEHRAEIDIDGGVGQISVEQH